MMVTSMCLPVLGLAPEGRGLTRILIVISSLGSEQGVIFYQRQVIFNRKLNTFDFSPTVFCSKHLNFDP